VYRLTGLALTAPPSRLTGLALTAPHLPMKKISVVEIGTEKFALFDSGVDTDGRLINLRYLVSVIPNFKQGGSMLFMRGTDKAIAVDAIPSEIHSEFTTSEEQ